MSAGLQSKLAVLRGIIPFDAVQLLGHWPGSGEHLEICQDGYGLRSARALACEFPRLYPPGFTRRHAPGELLPLSISESADAVWPPFRSTGVYQDALHGESFVDGMTVELSAQGCYLGMAHFSSRTAGVYDRHVRTLAHGARILLQDLVAQTLPLDGAVPGTARWLQWSPVPGGGLDSYGPTGPAPTPDARLGRVLRQLPPLGMLHCFWPEGRALHRLWARRMPAGAVIARLAPGGHPMDLSAREVTVLGWVMAGLADHDIAQAMCMGERTVHSHVASVLHKLGVQRRTQAAVQAAMHHWYVPDTGGVILRAVPDLCRREPAAWPSSPDAA